MAFFRKKKDPLTERARAIEQEIAQLEAEIRRLDTQGAAPSGAPVQPPRDGAASAPVLHEPIFERVDPKPLVTRAEQPVSADHYNELGVRKYDLPDTLRRLRNHLRGPSTTNPKLVSYLAAGGIQGLRPLRYERRVARNRFIVLVVVLFLTLLGIIAVVVRH